MSVWSGYGLLLVSAIAFGSVSDDLCFHKEAKLGKGAGKCVSSETLGENSCLSGLDFQIQ